VRDFLDEPPEDLDAVAALRPASPRLQGRGVVMRIQCRLEKRRRPALDRELDPPFPRVAVPDAIVEPELDFLFDVTRKILRIHPARMDVEGGLATVRILVC